MCVWFRGHVSATLHTAYYTHNLTVLCAEQLEYLRPVLGGRLQPLTHNLDDAVFARDTLEELDQVILHDVSGVDIGRKVRDPSVPCR